MSDVLSQLKPAEPAPFVCDGVEVPLRPIKFSQYREIMAWWRGAKDAPGSGELLERKIFALSVGCDEAVVDDLDPIKVEAIAQEIGQRCGLYKRPDEKKAGTPSTTPTPDSSSTSPSPGT